MLITKSPVRWVVMLIRYKLQKVEAGHKNTRKKKKIRYSQAIRLYHSSHP